MTIKILKTGVNPDKMLAREECPKCKSLLEFSKNDCRRGSQYNQSYLYLDCPICGATTDMINADFCHQESA